MLTHAVALPDKEALFAPEGLLAGCLQSNIVRAHADADALLLRGEVGIQENLALAQGFAVLEGSVLGCNAAEADEHGARLGARDAGGTEAAGFADNNRGATVAVEQRCHAGRDILRVVLCQTMADQIGTPGLASLRFHHRLQVVHFVHHCFIVGGGSGLRVLGQLSAQQRQQLCLQLSHQLGEESPKFLVQLAVKLAFQAKDHGLDLCNKEIVEGRLHLLI